MAGRLQESYAAWSSKVEERTRDLTEALGAADGDQRDPARDQQLADRSAAGAGRGGGERGTLVRRQRCADLSSRRRFLQTCRAVRVASECGHAGETLPDPPRPDDRTSRHRSHASFMSRTFSRSRTPISLACEGVRRQRRLSDRARGADAAGREAIGAILIRRTDVARSPRSRSSCCKTFADQAVIAIENVRLFQELQARTQELARSVEQLRSLAEVSQAVNSTLDLDQVLAHDRRARGAALGGR